MKREIPALKHQDVGGAELPYLYYEGGEKKILFTHATGFLLGCGTRLLSNLFRNIPSGRLISAVTVPAIRKKGG